MASRQNLEKGKFAQSFGEIKTGSIRLDSSSETEVNSVGQFSWREREIERERRFDGTAVGCAFILTQSLCVSSKSIGAARQTLLRWKTFQSQLAFTSYMATDQRPCQNTKNGNE